MTTPVAQTGAGDVTVSMTSLSSTLTGNKPSTVADGDLLVACPFSHKAAGTWSTVPSGWTQQGPSENAHGTCAVFTKPIPSAAGESATSYSWVNSAGADRGGIIICRVTGADLAAPLDIAGTWITSGATSIVTPGLTPNYANSLLLGFWQASNATSTASAISTPTGMTLVGSGSVTPTASSAISIAQQPLGAAGIATGNRAPSLSPSATASSGLLIAIAGPPQDSAALSATATLTATAGIGAAARASLAANSVLTASAVQAQFASAALTATATLSASPAAKPCNVLLADGTWAPIDPQILTGSGWQT